MKVFISADMEGATGIVNADALMTGRPEYERGRKLLTADVVAAAEGALNAGAKQVVVCEGHANMRNLHIEDFPKGVHLVKGPASGKQLCQTEGISKDFSCALFIGYHAMAGTRKGILSHTWVGSLVHAVHLNGTLVGETGINAAVCGHYGVPVVLVHGDDALKREARKLLPGIRSVVTKTALSTTAAICRPPSETLDELRTASEKAVRDRKEFAPLKLKGRVDFDVTLHRQDMADKAETYCDVKRLGDRQVRVTGKNMDIAARLAWKMIETLLMEHGAWNK